MAVEKLSVSLDPELARAIKDAAELNDESVSAFMAAAARQRLRNLLMDQWLQEEAVRLGTTVEEMADRGDELFRNAKVVGPGASHSDDSARQLSEGAA